MSNLASAAVIIPHHVKVVVLNLGDGLLQDLLIGGVVRDVRLPPREGTHPTFSALDHGDVDLPHHTQLLSECSLHDLCLAHSLLCSPYLQGPRHLVVEVDRFFGFTGDVPFAPCPVCHLHATLPRSALVMRSTARSERPLLSKRPLVRSYQSLPL